LITLKYKDLPDKFKKVFYERIKDGLEEGYELEGDNKPATDIEIMQHIKELNHDFVIEVDKFGQEWLEIKK
jgi:hypothetical protein